MSAEVAEVVLTGSLLLAIPLAMAAGLVSFFSPCVLPLVPAYLSYMTGLAVADLPARPRASDAIGATAGPRPPGPRMPVATAPPTNPPTAVRSRVVLGTGLFVLGFTAVLVSYGAIAGGLGSRLLEFQRPISVVLGLVTIVLGVAFAGWLPAFGRDVRLMGRAGTGLAAAPMLGMLFAIGWTPCIGPTLAAVQVLAFDQASAGRGAILSIAYSIGLGLPFLAVGLGMRHATRASAWVRRHQRGVQAAGGIGLMVLGLALVTGLWADAVAEIQGLVDGFEVAL